MAAQPASTQPIPTEEVQRLLEENYVFIKAIVDQQNLGRLANMAELQAKLQSNLMLLAALADVQPAPPQQALPAQPADQAQQRS